MASAAWLSLLMSVGGRSVRPISFNSDDIHVTSQHAIVMALYSASAVDLATTDCFLVFQEMGESPSNTQYPEVDLRVVGQLAQSLSQYAVNFVAVDDARSIPCAGLLIKYLRTRFTACICTFVGLYMNWAR